MKYKITERTEIRSTPSLQGGVTLGILEPGFVIDIAEEVEGSSDQEIWLKDGNGFFYLKSHIEAAFPTNTESSFQLNYAASKVPDWNARNFDVTRFWPYTTGKGIKVAVIDSGIFMHEDLVDAIDTVNQKAFGSNSILDTNGHGTHVAGIIGARGVTNMYGVAPECTIVPIKASNNDKFENAHLIQAVDYAASIPGVRIINMSLKANSIDKQGIAKLESAIKSAINKGKIVVTAGGNLPTKKVDAPARFAGVIAVGAVFLPKNSMQESYFIRRASQYGNHEQILDTAAPAVDIVSCINQISGLTPKSGTSMSAAFISGIIALKLQKHPNLSVQDITTALRESIFQFAQLENDPDIEIRVLDPNKFLNH